jgi:hypothetical protein
MMGDVPMVPVNEIGIPELVARLYDAVPREGAWVAFVQYGGGLDECAVYGSPEGYMRLGIEFLMAVDDISPSSTDEHYVQVDLGYLVDKRQSDIAFDTFRVVVPPEKTRGARQKIRESLGTVVGCLAASAFAAVFIVGLVSTVRWLAAFV